MYFEGSSLRWDECIYTLNVKKKIIKFDLIYQDCEDQSDELGCESQCCKQLKINNFEFYLESAANSRGQWFSEKGFKIHSEEGYWYIRNSDDQIFAFSKSESICPDSPSNDWSVYLGTQWVPMAPLKCDLPNVIGVLTESRKYIPETSNSNIMSVFYDESSSYSDCLKNLRNVKRRVEMLNYFQLAAVSNLAIN